MLVERITTVGYSRERGVIYHTDSGMPPIKVYTLGFFTYCLEADPLPQHIVGHT